MTLPTESRVKVRLELIRLKSIANITMLKVSPCTCMYTCMYMYCGM